MAGGRRGGPDELRLFVPGRITLAEAEHRTGVDDFEGVQVRPILRAEATVYYGASHPQITTPEQLREEPLYVLPEEEAPLSTDINLGYFSGWKLSPLVETLPNRESILLALSCGRGFAVFDNMMTCRKNSLYHVMPLGQVIPICAVWKKRNLSSIISPMIDWMEKKLAGQFGCWEQKTMLRDK